jgi:hypothetical protein
MSHVVITTECVDVDVLHVCTSLTTCMHICTFYHMYILCYCVLTGAPCLFRLDANVKSSEAVLKTFCQFLKGEGDIVRHLAKIGYVVTHTQCYIDEFDFSVNNIAVDLRDGVRLCRLVSHSFQRSNNVLLIAKSDGTLWHLVYMSLRVARLW